MLSEARMGRAIVLERRCWGSSAVASGFPNSPRRIPERMRPYLLTTTAARSATRTTFLLRSRKMSASGLRPLPFLESPLVGGKGRSGIYQVANSILFCSAPCTASKCGLPQALPTQDRWLNVGPSRASTYLRKSAFTWPGRNSVRPEPVEGRGLVVRQAHHERFLLPRFSASRYYYAIASSVTLVADSVSTPSLLCL